jgi:hypothetical protein
MHRNWIEIPMCKYEISSEYVVEFPRGSLLVPNVVNFLCKLQDQFEFLVWIGT